MFPSLGTLRARAPEQASARRDLAARVRRVLALAEEDALSVNEIACTDRGCPGIETVILVMRVRQPTRALKIAKPIEAVTDADVGAAMSAVAEQG
ncbi:hypothetical protein [Methylobacterium platani]|uniref:Nitrate reductase n=2 Tax=Methylobacterium platani TaxID=427683 RepID=A0A179SHW1_9HYPH|nr:hypothetical protein [Methylobacterium platani]KMO14185.1 hypothetical protein SQ03_20020 [Methylobacterium platani JCM 14648]OAS26570.1 hypothetical protein A5481_05855 [Methylobacterium platani]